MVYLRAVLALAFGSVVIAVALPTGSNAVRRVTGLGDAAALAIAVLATIALQVIGAVVGALLMLVMRLYLAANPELFRHGLLHLLPARQRGRVDVGSG